MTDTLTIETLKAMESSKIFATGLEEIPHPWYTGSIIVRWVAIRGGIHDWAIYHSLSTNLYHDREVDGCECHLRSSEESIASHGAKLHDMEMVQKLVPCDEEALRMYRH